MSKIGKLGQRKTIAAILLTAIASFAVGVYANKVTVNQVQTIGGNHVTLPAPELKVLTTIWNINLNRSLVTGLILNLTTVGGPNLSGSRVYNIFVQVSCLVNATTTISSAPPPPVLKPNCAVGTVSVRLPVNLNGTDTQVPLSIAPALDPETTEIDDLSFIVTESQDANTPSFQWTTPCLPGAVPDFAVVADPSFLILGEIPTPPPPFANVTETVTVYSLCGYSGLVHLAAAPFAQGINITFAQNPVTVQPGRSISTIDTITTDGSTPDGTYMMSIVGVDNSFNIHVWPKTVQVLPVIS